MPLRALQLGKKFCIIRKEIWAIIPQMVFQKWEISFQTSKVRHL
jgi:hypothetical protein